MILIFPKMEERPEDATPGGCSEAAGTAEIWSGQLRGALGQPEPRVPTSVWNDQLAG